MAARKPVPRGCSRATLLLAAAALLLLGWDIRPVDAHKRQAALKCQKNDACTPVNFTNFATMVPLTLIHQKMGLGNQDQGFEVAEMEPWTVSNGIWVPQISLCRGPGRFNHQWGVNTQGKKVYARAGSMLQYSYDGNAGDPPVVCDNPTYPGPILATKQGVGKTSFWFRNSVGSFHPMNFAVDPRLYNPPANVTVTKNKISYNPATASPTSTVDFTPAVVHVHGAVVSSEFDGVPYFTLTKTGDKTLHKFWDITNPAALALYHDHAWGFTRLTVYAGGISGFLIKENPALYPYQPKPTTPCAYAKAGATCGIPEVAFWEVDKYFANATTLQDIPLIISDRSLVSEAPSPTIAGSVDAELGYPRGQLNGCNSCTAPPDANLDSNAGTCTNPPVSVCAAAPWNNDTSYCGRWSPEFFGEVNVVNGQVTPVLKVSPIGWYRLRLVNGANTRTYALSFEPDVAGAAALLGDTNPRCYKIATEAGYTLKPLTVASPLKMLPAERVELLCDFRGYTSAVTYTVKNNETYVNPAGNPGQAEVMKITIDPTLVLKFGTIGNPGVPIYFNSLNITTQYKLNTMFYPTQRLATIPPLQQLFTAQDPSKQVVKHIMLMERLVRNPAVTNPNAPGYTCPQGLAVSECKTSDGPNGVPEQPTGSTSNAWGVPKNCLTESGMPRNMFADGLPLTCKEGLIEKWIWYNPTADEHPWHWHLNHVQCFTPGGGVPPDGFGEQELKETVTIPNDSGPNKATNATLECYVACADAQYILDSGEKWFQNPVPGNLVAALKAGIANGYNKKSGPSGDPLNPKKGTCSTTNTTYNDWDYVTHCHILEHEEYDMMAKYRIIPKTCTTIYP